MSEKINHQRCRFLGIAAMTIATTHLSRFGCAIAQSSKAQPKESTTTQPGTAIRSFRVNISKEALVNLRRRITATQWPEKEEETRACKQLAGQNVEAKSRLRQVHGIAPTNLVRHCRFPRRTSCLASRPR
ncbi:MAG: hypothetical protein KME55_31505 [Nostoc indistinguendum CM1-VF10]|jgi:enterochelin esterase-like enzyme|nr:hypothetical protein [Nostoc indistinguendum CM1-VF10]